MTEAICPMCLPVESVGRCAKCGYCGAGPQHACPEAPDASYCAEHRSGPRFDLQNALMYPKDVTLIPKGHPALGERTTNS